MPKRRDYIAEIQEIRARTSPSEFDNGTTKLLFLCTQLADLQGDAEQMAYFLVAGVAAMESYFRWQIRSIIDSGDQRFVSNPRLFEAIRLSPDLLSALYGRRVTVGDLVGHSLQLSSLESINRAMSELLGTDFLDLIKEPQDAATANYAGSENVIAAHREKMLANVTRTFKLRHIICHEAHLEFAIRLEEIKVLCKSCYEFVVNSSRCVAKFLNPTAPENLQQATQIARTRIRGLEQELTAAEEQLLSNFHGTERRSFKSMQKAWRSYADATASFTASLHMNGNRGELFSLDSRERLYEERLSELNTWIENGKRLTFGPVIP